jgi:hypothetical protein
MVGSCFPFGAAAVAYEERALDVVPEAADEAAGEAVCAWTGVATGCAVLVIRWAGAGVSRNGSVMVAVAMAESEGETVVAMVQVVDDDVVLLERTAETRTTGRPVTRARELRSVGQGASENVCKGADGVLDGVLLREMEPKAVWRPRWSEVAATRFGASGGRRGRACCAGWWPLVVVREPLGGALPISEKWIWKVWWFGEMEERESRCSETKI